MILFKEEDKKGAAMVEKIQLVPGSITNPGKTSVKGSNADKSSGGAASKNLNIDEFGLSGDARNKVIWARSQFELNYQVLRSVNSANGFETSQETFSFRSAYEFMQRASGEEATTPAQEGSETPAAEETGDEDQLTALQEYFSPENTARRILDVATSFFSMSEVFRAEGETEASRQKFADFIGGAVNEGFRQARAILGELPEDVKAGIDKTNSLVFSGLDDFVKNGIDPEKAQPGGVFEKIATYRRESAVLLARSQKQRSTVAYNASGEIQTPVDPKVSTTG